MRSRSGKVRLKTTPDELRSAGFLVDTPTPGQLLDWPAMFGNNLPVEVEIGPGKGAFLLRRAGERPEINLLGVEWVPSYAFYVADRAYRAGLTNVRTLAADAATLFKTNIPEQSLWRVHVYFPDPWPKARHQRRRLLQLPLLNDVKKALKIGGCLGIVTDHDDYFRQIERVVPQLAGMAIVPFPREASSDLIVGSNFEKKYRGTGKVFHTIAALRYR